MLGNRAAPTFNAYGRRYAKLTRYYGVTHPSLPNYLALVSGSTQGITVRLHDLHRRCQEPGGHARGSRAGRGRPTPRDCRRSGFLGGPSTGAMQRSTIPFAYFQDIAERSGQARAARPAGPARPRISERGRCRLLARRSGSLPLDARLLGRGRRRLAARQIGRSSCCGCRDTVNLRPVRRRQHRLRGGGHTPALAVGTAVRPGLGFHGRDEPLRVLRTIEQAWGLAAPRPLGRSRARSPASGVSAACRETTGGLE